MLEELVKLNLFAFLLVLARVGAMLSIIPGIAAAYVNCLLYTSPSPRDS